MEELTSGKKTDIAVKKQVEVQQKKVAEKGSPTYSFEEAVEASKCRKLG